MAVIVIADVVGADNAADRLERMAARMLNLAPAFDEIGEFFRYMVEAQFNAQAWAPLAPLTVRLRGSAAPILNVGGALKASWTSTGGPGNINEVGAMTAKFGSAHGKVNNAGQGKGIAAMHQGGNGMMPARPVKLVTPQLEEVIVEEIADWIVGGF